MISRNILLKVKLAIICLAVLLNFACKKSDENKSPYTGPASFVNSYILDYGTNIPVADAEVYLLRATGYDPFLSFETIAITYSDKLGKFSFSYTIKDEKDNFYLGVKKDDYHPADYTLVENKKEVQKNVYMVPYAILKLHLKNEYLPKKYNDEIGFSGYDMKYMTFVGRMSGVNADTIFWLLQYGNQINKLAFGITKNDSTLRVHKEIYCKGHDTTFFELFY
ncbi:MAG: hypothetical protein H7296_09115 [Bacteroidia bacterium]|nr:hypothetical protein [Bacteroidia bacterium]